jgi:hypothetical protein
MVLNGEQPVFEARKPLPPVELTESRIQSLRDLEQQYLGEVLLAKVHEDSAAGLRSAIVEILNNAGDAPLKGFKAPTEMVRMQISEKLDIKAIDETLRRHNQDPNEIRQPQDGKYDTAALLQFIEEQGEDPAGFLLQTVDKAKAYEAIADLGLPMSPYVRETITLKLPTATSKAGKALAPTRQTAEILAAGASDAFQSLMGDGENAGKAVTIEVANAATDAAPITEQASSPQPEARLRPSTTTAPS